MEKAVCTEIFGISEMGEPLFRRLSPEAEAGKRSGRCSALYSKKWKGVSLSAK
jgi:hypothetical protein